MLEVLDAPTKLRIIVDTKIPALTDIAMTIENLTDGNDIEDTMYFMIDRTNDVGITESKEWYVSSSCSECFTIPTNAMVLDFIDNVVRKCNDAKVWVETY